MRFCLEYFPVWLVAQTLRWLPRPAARAIGRTIGILFYWLHPRLRRVGMRNLALAFPEMPVAERQRILKGVYLSLGRLLAEVPKFPDYTPENVDRIAVYDGLENYLAARDRGKGVLFMTAHLGGWEIGSFVHSLHGHWLNIVVRDLDNPLLNRWVKHMRELHGNRTHNKDEYARGLIVAMKHGETVGALMDTNMTPPQGVFVDYFGVPACTAVGIARVAMRTGAAVLPAFTIWDESLCKYRIRFEPSIPTVCTGNPEADAIANTQNYTAAIERVVRAYPDQWLWVHRRWKTRPTGEPSLY
jgi:KDO2-lipid IV(A) lauroyltransferase